MLETLMRNAPVVSTSIETTSNSRDHRLTVLYFIDLEERPEENLDIVLASVKLDRLVP